MEHRLEKPFPKDPEVKVVISLSELVKNGVSVSDLVRVSIVIES